jgi:transcriptional regulator with XRE-family HTH domain
MNGCDVEGCAYNRAAKAEATPRTILGEALRLYVAAHRVEQRTAAAAIGISETTLSRLMNDGRLPDAAGFARLMAWLTKEHA